MCIRDSYCSSRLPDNIPKKPRDNALLPDGILSLSPHSKIEKYWLLYPLSGHWLPVLFPAETFLLSTHTAGWSRNDPADCI